MNARIIATELRYRTLLQEDLESTRALLVASCQSIPLPVRHPVEQLINSGGKRLRPALVLLVAHMCEADGNRALQSAAAVEMLHTATLIHDDLIDNAATRRGVQTLNAQWPAAAAVLAGDIVFAEAAKLMSRTHTPLIVEQFAAALETICRGELNQMFRIDGLLPSRAAYFERIFAKTASLFMLCTEIGPLLAQCSDETAERARRFGKLLGEAFQITDDVLDLLGDSRQIGKPVGADLRQGLATLPVLLYAESRTDDLRINAILNQKADEATIEGFIEDLRLSGATDQAMQHAEARIAEALVLLQEYPESPHRRALEELVHFAVDRVC